MSGKILRFSLIGMLFVCQLALAQERMERPGLGRSAPQVLLRNARAVVEVEHDAIWNVDPRQAHERYRGLASTMKADVWTMHFEQFLNDHPDLTPIQRAVVIDALALVEGGIIEASIAYQNNPDLFMATHAPIEQLERRAIGAFGLDQERALLELPGRPEDSTKVSIAVPDCNCRGNGDCLEGETCVPRFQSHCTFVIECGALADQSCTGLCLVV
ncbi:MAG TPA: bacteriocin fulvocin C-related protein [Thermoanaerobaculia bacterium]|nr:bacteriocin fulvocin C-related protein [Thermoanaerobaculia bacterium]